MASDDDDDDVDDADDDDDEDDDRDGDEDDDDDDDCSTGIWLICSCVLPPRRLRMGDGCLHGLRLMGLVRLLWETVCVIINIIVCWF